MKKLHDSSCIDEGQRFLRIARQQKHFPSLPKYRPAHTERRDEIEIYGARGGSSGGREFYITDDRAITVSGEDGRRVKRLNISPFIKRLPSGNMRFVERLVI